MGLKICSSPFPSSSEHRPSYALDNHVHNSNRIAYHKSLHFVSCVRHNMCTNLHVICGHPPFLFIYRLHPGHLFAIFLMIFSVFLSTLLAPAACFASYSSHVMPACHAISCCAHATKLQDLHVTIGSAALSEYSCPKEQPGPRHHRKFGTSVSRVCRILR
jgi:hypothetical protein